MNTILHYILYVLLIPHYIVYSYFVTEEIKGLIDSDVDEMNKRLKRVNGLFYYMSFHKPYRNLFYYRVGSKKSRFLKLFIREYSQFYINDSLQYWGKNAFVLNHPYGTIINARRIGDNFTICQLTTLGNKMHGRNDLIPSIGNNVSLGANVNILGGGKNW